MLKFTKKILCLLVCLLFLYSPFLSSISTSAYEYISGETEDGFMYHTSFFDSTGVEIVGYNGTEQKVVIPDEIAGYPVNALGDNAFAGCNNISEIILSNSITHIGFYPFKNCSNLSRIFISDNVDFIIPQEAFSGCFNLKEIVVSENNLNFCSIDGVLFNKDKTKLIRFPLAKSADSYVIPDSVTTIEDYAFDNCVNLKKITMPNSIVEINSLTGSGISQFAFSNCSSLTSITLSDSLTVIPAFNGCTNLKKLNIPKETKTIYLDLLTDTKIADFHIPNQVSALYNNEGFLNRTTITVDESNKYFFAEDGILFNKDKTILYSYPCAKTNLTYNIPSTVTTIYRYAFSYNNNIKYLDIPNSVTNILDYVFKDCTSLEHITLPDSLSCNLNATFWGCSNLKELHLPYNVSASAYITHQCTALTKITVDNNNKYLCSDEGVLFDKSKRTLMVYPSGKPDKTYYIPDDVEMISFISNCMYLEELHIPKSVSLIANNSISNNPNLKRFIVSNENESFKDIDGVLMSKDQQNLRYYPDGKGNTFTVPQGTTRVNFYANNVEIVSLPDSIKELRSRSFVNCTNLKYLVIPESIEVIHEEAIYNCSENLIILGAASSCAEKYAKENNYKFIITDDDYIASDKNSGISVIGNDNISLKVKQFSDKDTIDKVNLMLTNEVVTNIYDITLIKDDIETEPSGTVTVKMPTNNKNSKVYHINQAGNLTDMNAVFWNGYMIFTTDHFSLYAVTSFNNYTTGDVNLDHILNIKDATAIQKHLAGIQLLSQQGIFVADVNNDSSINIKDATTIQKKLAGLIP